MNMELFSDEIILINNRVGFTKKDCMVYYFNGQMPIFQHHEDDSDNFRMYLSQLYVTNVAKQIDIVRACNVRSRSLKRWVHQYINYGPSSFHKKKQDREKIPD